MTGPLQPIRAAEVPAIGQVTVQDRQATSEAPGTLNLPIHNPTASSKSDGISPSSLRYCSGRAVGFGMVLMFNFQKWKADKYPVKIQAPSKGNSHERAALRG